MPDSQEFPSRIVQEMETRARPCVVPLMVSDMGAQTMHACASGTLFQIADQHFLVTAAHVFEQAREHFDSRLFTSDYRTKSPTVPLKECRVHHYKHAAIDVAVFELTDLVLSQIPNRIFLRLADVEFGPDVPKGRYYLYGWPCELTQEDKTEETVTLNSFSFVTQLHTAQVPSVRYYEPEIHVLLSTPTEAGGSVPLLGAQMARPGSLSGISGCSLWKACDSDTSAPTWTADDARIVGVQSSAIGTDHSIIKGVRWSAVAAIIWHEYPDLRRPMMITQPEVANEMNRLAACIRATLLKDSS